MDGFTNPKIEKQLIYEIYRGCRLCGGGAGYKMPIIQNVVDLDSGEIELKQKIRECVQIEVHQDDKMPPLICEVCLDKVNDFYEFLEHCRQTNKQTRLRLGLPPQSLPRGAPDAGDCILGVTEPIFVDNEDSNEPIVRSKPKPKSFKMKVKEPDSLDSRTKDTRKEKEVVRKSSKDRHEPRTLRRRSPSPAPPSPPRQLRGTRRSHEDDVSLSKIQKSRRSDEPMPRSILKRSRESQSEERVRTKRLREKENEKIANEKANSKKVVKIVLKKEDFKSLPKAPSPKPQQKTSAAHRCKVCKKSFDNGLSFSNHMRSHAKEKPVERKPSPPPKKEGKKLECRECHRLFVHRNLLDIHRCGGRNVASSKEETEEKPEKPVKPMKPASKPQRTTTPKKRAEVPIDPDLLKLLRPLQVRISKCDPLLENKLGDHYDASDVDYDYGLDRACVYPYIYTFRHLRIKSEPLYMVNIQDEIKNAIDKNDSYVHWDSDETDSDLDLDDSKSVDTLTSISLKTLFSQKVLGKVPKKRRKVKVEKEFDSILNSTNDFDSDMRLGIDDIINSLGDDKDKSTLDGDSAKIDKTDNDSLFGDDNSPAIAVTNDDFDSLFSGDASKTVDKNIDTKSVDSNITDFSMDFTEDVGVDKTNPPKLQVPVQDSKTVESKELNKNDDSDGKNVQDDTTSKTDDKNDSNGVSNADTYENTTDAKDNQIVTENNISEAKDLYSENKEKDDANKEKDDANREKDDANKEKDHVNKEKDDANKEKDDANKEKDDANKEKDDVNKEKNDENREKDDANKEKDDVNKEKDNTNKEKDDANKVKDDVNHVNGQTDLDPEFNMDDLEDVSDSEMEASMLMHAIDKQIEEKGTANAKTDVSEQGKTITDDVVQMSVKSTDLESISDGEFE
ncbi:titin homolog isoform X2 [Maniola hyperantus]|uniref:titin homolog isoform X2 n=1 Tax=Aphantopus hyperantus TaxID=2795564 RepID=UPI003749E458